MKSKLLITTFFLLTMGLNISSSASITDKRFLQGGNKTFNYTPTGNVSEITVSIGYIYSDILIIGTSENKIRIETKDYEGLPEKAQGLKPLSATGVDNTDIGLSVKQEGNVINILGASRVASDTDYTIYLPKNMAVKLEYNSFQADDIRIEGMAGEVEVESKIGDIEMVNITGPVVINTLSADVEIMFSALSQAGPTSITSTSGDIDISMPAGTKGNFELKTVSGEIYTNLEFQFDDEEGMRRWGGGMTADAALNGGGVRVTIGCISGDVYLRKGE